MYNFVRLTQAGPDKGGYYHLNLQRGKPDLIRAMQRTRVNGRRTRRPANPDDEPDFRLLPPLPAIVSGTRIDVPHDSTVEAKSK
jgi:hypothetical protein